MISIATITTIITIIAITITIAITAIMNIAMLHGHVACLGRKEGGLFVPPHHHHYHHHIRMTMTRLC